MHLKIGEYIEKYKTKKEAKREYKNYKLMGYEVEYVSSKMAHKQSLLSKQNR